VFLFFAFRVIVVLFCCRPVCIRCEFVELIMIIHSWEMIIIIPAFIRIIHILGMISDAHSLICSGYVVLVVVIIRTIIRIVAGVVGIVGGISGSRGYRMMIRVGVCREDGVVVGRS
jgi:hypothetical protein